MEATSVRMADSARMGQGVGWQPASLTPLQRYIRNTCDPQNYEPNLALNMEIVDLINSKGVSAYVTTIGFVVTSPAMASDKTTRLDPAMLLSKLSITLIVETQTLLSSLPQ